ncbi:DUF927 domain-containing protein [Acidisphaera sp. S103]|uniref:DUF927 domain-containing protein n=1 Tax=Acidisphaera sp. S103 TaxID=1747223 RepID=UPI00131CA701|nr:DUF927 domain-containing protein [Acidisphaera sp. S103]
MADLKSRKAVPFPTKPSGRNRLASKKPTLTKHIRLKSFAEGDAGEFFIKVEFEVGKVKKNRLFRLDNVSVNSKQFNQLNLDGAKLISPAARNEFIARVQQFPDNGKRLQVATRLGWNGWNFVLPKRRFGPSTRALLVHLEDAQSERFTRFRVSGTIEGWRRLGGLAIGNTRIVLFISAAFSGPVAALLGLEQVGIMLVGNPITGKTTVNKVAGSIWGCHIDPNKAREMGFGQPFNATEGYIEDDFLAANHTLLVLDETRGGGLDDKDIGPSLNRQVMRLSSGFQKGRLTDTGPRRSSAVPILMSSNLSLQQFGNLAGNRIDDALHSRMMAVPLPQGGQGAFENLHGSKDAATFSAVLRKLAEEHFGHPSQKFLAKLTAENSRNPEKLGAWLKARRESFLRSVEDIASPTQNLDRTKAKFATIYASARFAIKVGILPWKVPELARSLRSCLLDHVNLVAQEATYSGVAGNTRTASASSAIQPQPLAQLRDYVRSNGDRIVDLAAEVPADRLPREVSDWPILQSIHKENGREYLFTDKALLTILGDKSRVQRLKLTLNEAGQIATEKGSGGDLRYSVKRTIPGRGREQFIAIKAEAIDSEA